MKKQVIYTESAPKPIGIYSQAIAHGQTLYISGQIPLVPETMVLVSEEIEAQIEQVFKNIGAILEKKNTNFSSIVKMTIFLTNLADFPLVNAAMTRYFSEPYPARVVIEVSALPKGAKIEIDAIAALADGF